MTPEELAKFWSEWTDDNAPLNVNGVYLMAANAFLQNYEIKEKSK